MGGAHKSGILPIPDFSDFAIGGRRWSLGVGLTADSRGRGFPVTIKKIRPDRLSIAGEEKYHNAQRPD